MTDATIEFAETSYGDTVVLSPKGRLDQETSKSFQEQLLAMIADRSTDRANLILDMSGVNYISSIGLRALMIVAKQCSAGNGQLALANLSPVVVEIFEISRFNLIISTFDEIRSAIAEIAPDALSAYDSES